MDQLGWCGEGSLGDGGVSRERLQDRLVDLSAGSSTVCLLWEVRAVSFSLLASQCLAPCLTQSKAINGQVMSGCKKRLKHGTENQAASASSAGSALIQEVISPFLNFDPLSWKCW